MFGQVKLSKAKEHAETLAISLKQRFVIENKVLRMCSKINPWFATSTYMQIS